MNQLESSFILWIYPSDSIKKEINSTIHLQFQCHQMMAKSIEEKVSIRPHSVSVLAISTACSIPVEKYGRKLFSIDEHSFSIDQINSIELRSWID